LVEINEDVEVQYKELKDDCVFGKKTVSIAGPYFVLSAIELNSLIFGSRQSVKPASVSPSQ
jgi:hypothetical protein